MFTGIVEELGGVVSLDHPADARLTIKGHILTEGLSPGDSLAVNGVCLTVSSLAGEHVTADVMPETLAHTALGALRLGDPVNLERAMRLDGRLGGHLVQGHVDTVVRVLQRDPHPRWDVVRFELPNTIERYVVSKGSITLDGVSLTISNLGPGWAEVSLIPETLQRTTLGLREVGEALNVEVDVLAKYTERLLAGEHR